MFRRGRHYCACVDGLDKCEIGRERDYSEIKKYPGARGTIESEITADQTRRWAWKLKDFIVKDLFGNERRPKFFYVLFFDADTKERVREYERIIRVQKNKVEYDHTINDDRELAALVLGLYSKKKDHGFAELINVTGMWKGRLMVDKLSEIKESTFVYYGFLMHRNRFAECERVAVKRNEKFSLDREKRIDLAMKSGGQYNMKYLKCSNIENDVMWVAMELCSERTLQDLITQQENEVYSIDHAELKICFRHILQGLMHLHRQNIAHGQILLQHILLALPNKDHLKIGHCYELKEGEAFDIKQDLSMTARVFFKCLIRDDDAETKQMSNGSNSLRDSWLSELKYTANELNNSEKDQVSKILRVVFHENFSLDSSQHYELSPDMWTGLLRKLTDELKTHQSDATDSKDRCLSVYLIMHMVLDEPAADQILHHPFFWDEYKILDFIVRTEGYFHRSDLAHGSAYSVSKTIKDQFCEMCRALWPELDWNGEVASIGSEYCDEIVRKCMVDEIDSENGEYDAKKEGETQGRMAERRENVPYEKKKYNANDITKYLRYIRNKYAHYHEPVKKGKEIIRENVFKSAADVWKCFGNILPEMICLLHRSVWLQLQRNNEKLRDDLRQFFTTPNNADTLSHVQ